MDDVGVAWIKLLALPDEYRKFIIEHEVENVIIAGIGEDVKSESYCRKLSKTGVDGQEYADGSLYIYIPNPVQSMTSKRYQEMSWTMIRYLLKR